jgi:hypothetical protein
LFCGEGLEIEESHVMEASTITRFFMGNGERLASLSTTFYIHAVALLLIVIAVSFCRRFTPVYILLVLPGTLMHELCHWLVGVLTMARPGFPSIIPHRSPTGWTLGSVSLRNARWFNGALVALAPLLLLPAAVWLYFNVLIPIQLSEPSHWILLYLVIVSTLSALPSPADLRIAWKCSAPILMVFAIASTGFAAWRFGLLK